MKRFYLNLSHFCKNKFISCNSPDAFYTEHDMIFAAFMAKALISGRLGAEAGIDVMYFCSILPMLQESFFTIPYAHYNSGRVL